MFNSKIGNISRIFSFILKGETSEAKKCINALMAIESPLDILEKRTPNGRFVFKRFKKINDAYEKLKKQALSHITKGKVDVFRYVSNAEDMGFSADLSTEMGYLYPEKIILIAREKEDAKIEQSSMTGP